jgi:N-acetylneuraminic acid mutarotase
MTMHGDFSRGHRPDRKRGKAYQRVLLQQGRALLDSDFNALSDAHEHLLRELALDAGVGNGRVGGGFLLSNGPVVARFDSLARLDINGVRAQIDPRHPFRETFPALHIDGTRASGSVTVRLPTPVDGALYSRIRVWARNPGALRVHISGGTGDPSFPAGGSATEFRPYDFEFSGRFVDSVEVGFQSADPANEAWIGLIEAVADTGTDLGFWVSEGRYRVDGLAVELERGGLFPEVSYPSATKPVLPTLGPGLYVAYLEAWERHLTHLDDPGLLEAALGGAVDTCTRTRALGQVKVAPMPHNEPPPSDAERAWLWAAFTASPTGRATLRVELMPVRGGGDPFGPPLSKRYTGGENRLYRFEVHTSHGSELATLKWSRNNGSDVFPVLRVVDDRSLIALPRSCDVRNGDLIEVLSTAVELGDGGDGRLEGPGYRFTPPSRLVGELFYVREKGQNDTEKLFELRDLKTRLPAQLGETLAAQPGKKIRRWDGYFQQGVSDRWFRQEIEDGIQVVMEQGLFRPGDYWQYEARREPVPTEDPWQPLPHGPERLFAPLAVLRYEGNGVVEILQWLEPPDSKDRGPLWAKEVFYDGSGVPTDADTVQEALEELYARGGGDCQVTLHPGAPGADDGARITEAIRAKLPRGGVVCLTEGLYTLRTPVRVGGMSIELRGHGQVTVVSAVRDDAGFQLASAGSLTLSRLKVRWEAYGGPALISLESGGDTFFAKDCLLIHAQTGRAHGIALHTPGAVFERRDRERADTRGWEQPFAPVGPTVRLERCTVLATHGLLVNDLKGLHLQDSTFLCTRDALRTKDVGVLELQGVTLDTGFTEGALASLMNLSPEAYEEAVTQLRQDLLPFAPRSTGTALDVTRIGRGAVVDSILAAGIGLWAGAAANLLLARNRYFAGDTALRVDDVTSTRVEAEEIVSQGIGIHVPRAAWELLVSGCQVKANRAVLLGGEYLEAPTADQRATFPLPFVSLRDVRVSGNRIEGSRFGVHVGPNSHEDMGSPEVELWNLDVSENTIWGTELTAVGLSGNVPFSVTTSFVLRVTHNHVEVGGTALRMAGSGLEIRQNRFQSSGAEALDEASPTGVVALLGAGNFLVEGNVLQLQMESAGLCVKDGYDAWVWRNTVLCPDGARPLWVLDSQRVEIGENDFRAGRCVVTRTESLTVSGNRVAGALAIQESGNVVVARNRVEQGGEDALSIEKARDYWQVSENFAAGGIRLLPSLLGAGTPPSEGEFHVQAQGNWSCDLQIGHVNPIHDVLDLEVAEPHPMSVVQVIGNRADSRLIVNHYERALIVHNVIRELISADAVPGRVIIGPNVINENAVCRTGSTGGGGGGGGGGGDPAGSWLPAAEMAEGRISFTASLLINGQVLAVGGMIGTTASASAELYDPATATWSSTTALKYARRHHTATVVGAGLLVVGGVVPGASIEHATAEMYNPAMRSWTLTRMALAAGRQGHTATLLPSGKVLVIGGSSADGQTTGSKTAELYSHSGLSGSWALLAQPMAQPRVHHTATLLAPSRVLVVGGWDGTDSAYFAELYDPDATTPWTTVSTGAPASRREHTATLLPSGKVLVVGGRDASTALASAYLFDPGTRSWSATMSLSVARFGHTAMLLPTGQVLVAGGRTGSVSGQEVTSSAELYDPSTGTWSPTRLLNSPRGLHAAVSLFSGDVLVVGGTGGGGVALKKSELYPKATGPWSTAHPMQSARAVHTATLLSTGKILVAGGAATLDQATASVELYDPKGTSSSSVRSMKTARMQHTATLLPNDKVLVVGGRSGGSTILGAELYDPSMNEWTDTGLTSVRIHHTATLLGSGKVLVVGGWNGSTVTGETNVAPSMVYDPVAGTWSPIEVMKRPRLRHAAVLLASGKVLVCGGNNSLSNDYIAEAELYDPDTNKWTDAGLMKVPFAMPVAFTLLPSGKVFVFGSDMGTYPTVDHAELYDPVTHGWSYTGLPVLRAQLSGADVTPRTATLLPSGKILVMPGMTTLNSPGSPPPQLYDPETEVWFPFWSPFDPLSPPWSGHAAVLLPSGELLIMGGHQSKTGRVSSTVSLLASPP